MQKKIFGDMQINKKQKKKKLEIKLKMNLS